ncbi:MAG: type II secretion system protein GspM [Gemmatimonadaceae bacterium]
MPIARLTRRERGVVTTGAAVVIAALLLRFAIVPFVGRWNAREDMIAFSADRIERMRGLIADDVRLRAALGASEPAGGTRRLVSGRTTALAGAALQAVIQSDADRSRVTINRLDLAGTPDSTASSSLPSIPVTISAVGDVYGLSEFLSALQYGAPVVRVKQLTVVSNSSLRGGLLQMSLQLSAPAVIE